MRQLKSKHSVRARLRRTLCRKVIPAIIMKFLSYLPLTILCFVGCTGESTPQPVDSQASSVTPAAGEVRTDEPQSFGEFSFSVPSGWTVVTPDRDKTKAMLLLDGTNWQNAKAMIKIDVGTPAAPTAKQLAEGFAKSTGGSVAADTLDFDGTLGVSATTSSNDLTTPRHMIVIYRDGKAYLLMAGATAGVDVGDAVSYVRESWRWTSPNAG